MIKKRVISSLLACVLAFSFAGCSGEAKETAGEAEVALVEPVVEGVSGEKAAYRNIYNYKTYSAFVYPTVTEYSFSKTTEVEEYKVFWGEAVEKDAVMVAGSTEDLDEQIEAMEEKIASLTRSMVGRVCSPSGVSS